ncbi:MAG: N-acetylglucosamine-6-phosphate deacetylase, partial [Sphingomonadales bacterium]|nr:N-acetylglucosamine-6-phosphate deacetylase [Sphingomonadales bacterium]
MKALINGHVLTADGFKSNQSLIIDKGMIVDVCDDSARDPMIAIERDLEGQTLLAGFIDTQVNGGGGVLFNTAPTVEGIKAIGAAHRAYGTTGFFPTLISDDLDIMAAAI